MRAQHAKFVKLASFLHIYMTIDQYSNFFQKIQGGHGSESGAGQGLGWNSAGLRVEPRPWLSGGLGCEAPWKFLSKIHGNLM